MARQSVPIVLGVAEQEQMEAVVRATTSPHRLVQRSRMALLAAAGQGTKQIAAELRVPAS